MKITDCTPKRKTVTPPARTTWIVLMMDPTDGKCTVECFECEEDSLTYFNDKDMAPYVPISITKVEY
jgi:hypothetical protein